VLFLQTAVI